jgi:hypothetical protein
MQIHNGTYESYKKSPYKSLKHTTYFSVYDRLLSKYIGKEFTFVEVGVLWGGSLFMWRDYFGPRARIIGVDVNPSAKQWEKEGYEIYIGSQSDPEFWSYLYRDIGPVDVLLDDGGHTFQQQIITIENSLPHINNGGLLIVEDTHTSYMKDYGGPNKNSFISYSKNIVDGINYRFSSFFNKVKSEDSIFSIQYFESIVVFEIDRKQCSYLSKPTDNGGLILEEKKISKYANIKNIPIIGSVGYCILSTFRSIKKRINFYFINYSLKRYIKYR